MNPLFEKYFTGELSEAEEASLEDVLTGSLEEAWEFGQKAEQLYKAYGLPPLPDPPFTQGRPFRAGRWLGALLLLMLLGAAAWWWTRTPKVQTVPAVPVEKPQPAKVKETVPPHRPPEATATAVPTPPLGAAEKESGNNLKVVVKRKDPGAATVRVLDAAGNQVRLLYSGQLDKGDWAFEWDGRGADGRLVGPGKYRIEVLTEGVTQSRNVDIR